MSGFNLHAYYMPDAAFPQTGTRRQDPPLLPTKLNWPLCLTSACFVVVISHVVVVAVVGTDHRDQCCTQPTGTSPHDRPPLTKLTVHNAQL